MDRDIKKVSKISEDVINLAFLKYIKAYNECVFFKLCATPNSKKLAGGGGGGGGGNSWKTSPYWGNGDKVKTK